MHMENDFHLADRNNMNKDKVTIHDVARAANVSPATVSRVLNNSDHPVKPELKEKILLASKQLGYIPNPVSYTHLNQEIKEKVKSNNRAPMDCFQSLFCRLTRFG